METLEIKRENALKAYDRCDRKHQKLLEILFGRKVFQKNIMERVKTYEDACAEFGISPEIHNAEAFSADEIAFKKLKVICQALNEGWVPDWSDHNQTKYYPWFEVCPWGSGLSYLGTVDWYTGTNTASRLCYKSRELAAYAGKQFIAIYQDFILPNQ